MFFDPIQQCAAQVYQSAFVFMPNCYLRDVYRQKLEDSTKFELLAGRGDSWDACTRVLEGHSSFVNCVRLSPDGLRIASASCDGTVRLSDVSTGAIIVTLPCAIAEDVKSRSEKRADIHAVAFTPDGRNIATGSVDGLICFWDVKTGTYANKPISAHSDAAIHSLAFSHTGLLASSSADRSIRLFTASDHKLEFTLSGHQHEVSSIAFSPDGRMLASGSVDQTIRLWNPDIGEGIGEPLRKHSSDVHSVTFSLNGAWLASCSRDGSIRIWELGTRSEIAVLSLPTIPYDIAFNKTNSRIAVACSDNTVQIWDPRKGVCVNTMKGHMGPVYSVAFSPDGHTVASGSTDQTTRLWDPDASSNSNVDSHNSHSGVIFALAKSSDGAKVASCSSDGTLRLWNFTTGEMVHTFRGHQGAVYGVSFSPDLHGDLVASGSADGTVIIWNSNTGDRVGCLSQTSGSAVYSVSFSPDGTKIGYATWANTAYIVDAKSEGYPLIAECKGHTNNVYGVTFSPCSKVFATSSTDRTIRLWDSATGAALKTLEGHVDTVWAVEYLDGGRYLAASLENEVVLWDMTIYRQVDGKSKGENESEAMIGAVGNWVEDMKTKQRLSWLPLHCRPYLAECTVTYMSDTPAIAMGTEAGKVVILRKVAVQQEKRLWTQWAGRLGASLSSVRLTSLFPDSFPTSLYYVGLLGLAASFFLPPLLPNFLSLVYALLYMIPV